MKRRDRTSASRDPGPMARLEARIADPATPQAIVQLCAAGYTIGQIARQWGVPKNRLIDWIASNADLHLTCRRAWELFGHELVARALKIIGTVTPENLSAVQADLRANLLLKRVRVYEGMAKKRLRDYTDEELQAILAERRPAVDAEPLDDGGSGGAEGST